MGHFYHKLDDGAIKSRHYTPYAKPRFDGEREILRASTISDLRKWLKNGENCAPSVTTIQDVLAKPALVNWVANKYIDKAYELNPSNYQSVSLWNDAVRYKADTEMEQAPKAGTDFHKLMEDYVYKVFIVNTKEDERMLSICQDVSNLILEKTGISDEHWRPEVNIFSDMGYAGQADLVIGNDWVIDYKTKETKEKFKPGKMHFDNHAEQLSAYAMEISPKCRCANIFVCLETGELDWHEWKPEDLMKGFEVFTRCLEIYQIKNKL